jgi:hypothetical protein
MRVLPPVARKSDAGEALKPELGWVEPMLAGEDQRRENAVGGERADDRIQFDRFRPGANDQPDVPAVQPSP